jgi:hypothetical protein
VTGIDDQKVRLSHCTKPKMLEVNEEREVRSSARSRKMFPILPMLLQKVRLSRCTNPMMLEVMRNEKSEAQSEMKTHKLTKPNNSKLTIPAAEQQSEDMMF